MLEQLEDPSGALAQEWDRQHDIHVFQKLLTIIEPSFEPKTWQAFSRLALDGLAATQVAADLGISVSAVIQAKFRILKRLREEAGDFLE